ncbi:hypothetical protein B0H17DRAFT_1201024 [Mycena rosella]|uniref:Acetyl-CoA synthetase-like protein n=1 Tax=Mycena rosella TaxID=1033263 RepID=A0AAD7DKF3_MYCRO|nr:hypothetical protein B0H17DRAFT_1201024 [Mycena rosella]
MDTPHKLMPPMSLYDFMFTQTPSSSMNSSWFLDSKTGYSLTGVLIQQRVDALALRLQIDLQLGLDPKLPDLHRDCQIYDVVAMICPNCVDFATVLWASHKLGCTVTTISSKSTVEELHHQLSLSGARTIFAHASTLDRVLGAAERCGIPTDRIVVISEEEDKVLQARIQSVGARKIEELFQPENVSVPHDMGPELKQSSPIAFLCWSSGTTGLPKAVVIPHSAVIANIIQMKKSLVPSARVCPGDRALGVIPFSHMFGLLALVHLCPHLGISTVAFNSMPSFNTFLETVTRLRVNHLFLVPPLVNAFVKHPATAGYDLTFFKSGLIAAAPLDAEQESAFQALGGPDFLLTQGFGMTECSGLITALPVGKSPRPGSVGCILSDTDVKIIDGAGNILPPGQRGHLCVRGPQLCLGYLGNPTATQGAFDTDGFLFTGDIAEITADGYIYIVDRLKYMIKNKGYQVSPAELEAHLLGLDIVYDAGVIGKPDDRCGQVPVAAVVLSAVGIQQAKADPAAVKSAIKRSIQEVKSDYKWLHEVHFVQEIPRLPSGKILGEVLKKTVMTQTVDYFPPDAPSSVPNGLLGGSGRKRRHQRSLSKPLANVWYRIFGGGGGLLARSQIETRS